VVGLVRKQEAWGGHGRIQLQKLGARSATEILYVCSYIVDDGQQSRIDGINLSLTRSE
jgi:hypothetical protein